MEQILIPGDAGNIEGLVSIVSGSNTGAVLSHPHPHYGGSLEDATVGALASAGEAERVSTIRFNFRGVGQSDGDYDDGVGEVQDVISVTRYFVDSCDVANVLLGGYSFGAGVAMRAASAVEPAGMILVAPPLRMIEDIAIPACPILVIVGEKDQIVPAKSIAGHFADTSNVRVETVPGADHFFFGHHGDVQGFAREFLRGT
jgi:alpha/beta superfamily hydrolase